MEFVSGGELFEYIVKHGKVSLFLAGFNLIFCQHLTFVNSSRNPKRGDSFSKSSPVWTTAIATWWCTEI